MGDYGDNDRARPGIEPVAICGMSMRLPGNVRDAHAFWKALIEKSDLVCTVPSDRFNVDAYYSEHGKPGTIISPKAYYLTDAELGHFDTSMFPISPHELRHIDPQQRMLLEITQECLENAGEINWRGKQIGCYVGTFGEDWLDLGAKDFLAAGMYRAAGTSDFALSNRITYEYDFRGPSMTIKTGCSAAMMGLNEACWAINAGQCEAAIIAGANLIMTPTMTVCMGSAALSPTGSCKTFDATADGYARGEAVNAIYVKRLSKALEDGNAIRAVIKGIGVNSDGHTSSTLTPSLICQESLIRQTYAQAGLPVEKTAFFECHGTGTKVGDPIEAGAVERVFGDAGIHIGAVKPNFGHSEGASAITSIFKAVLALEKKAIPPNMRFSKPSPAINWGEGRLMVPTEQLPWPQNREARVSVNSFGIGGANGHVIIESGAARSLSPGKRDETKVKGPQLLVLSATHEKSLARLKSSYEALFTERSIDLYDLAHTLGSRRIHHKYRAYCSITPDSKAPKFSTTSRVSGNSQIVFVFSGQGNTRPRMAEHFLKENVTFRQTFARLESVLAILPDCKFSLEKEMLKEKEDSRLQGAEVSQPLNTAIQICLCNALTEAGVRPDAVVGHSSGEIAAAYASGALTEEEAIKVAFFRGQATEFDSGRGAMSSVGLGRDVVERLALHGVTLACDNSPSSTTLSGSAEEIEQAEVSIQDAYPNALIKRVQVDKAYHSRHMKSAGETYKQMLADHLHPARPKVPFFSALRGGILDESEHLGPAYWSQHLEGPVLFRNTTEAIVSEMKSNIILAEIGAHPTLTGSLIQTCTKQEAKGISHVSFMRRSHNNTTTFLDGLGRLYQLGVTLDFNKLTPDGRTLTDLPNYPWHHETVHWNETRIGREWRFPKFPRHDLLGIRTGESTSIEPSWRNALRLDDVDWIKHHRVASDVVLPFTAFCAMAGEAVQQIHCERAPFSLRRVRVGTPLVLEQSASVEIITSLRPSRLNDINDSSWFEFTISSFDGSQWNKHCTGAVRLGRDATSAEETQTATVGFPRVIDTEALYTALADVGLQYGTEFQRLRSISADVRDRNAVASIEDERNPKDSSYEIHPASLDCAIQLIAVAASRGMLKDIQNLFVPIGLEEMYIAASEDVLKVRAEADLHSKGTISGTVTASSGDTVVLQVKGITLYPLDGVATERSGDTHAAAELTLTPDPDLCELAAAVKCANLSSADVNGADLKMPTLEEVISLVAQADPLISILELGNGSHSLTESIVKTLQTPYGERLFSTYNVGCLSGKAQTELKQRLKDLQNVTCAVLDIAASGMAHGKSYDLILVDNNLLRQSPNTEVVLSNLARLASPGAWLLVHDPESLTTTHSIDKCKHSGQWSSADVLSQAGFSHIEFLGDTLLVARSKIAAPETGSQPIALLCADTDDALVHKVVSLCAARDICAKPFTLKDLAEVPSSEQIALSLIDVQGKPSLFEPSQQEFEQLLTIFRNQTHGIVWLYGPGPNYATILGMARTVRHELQTPFYTLELPDINSRGARDAVMKVLTRCLQHPRGEEKDSSTKSPLLDPDFEYVLRDGCVQVQRFRWKSIRNDLLSATSGAGESSRPVLQIGKIGHLDTLQWAYQTHVPMEKHYVEVNIKAVGVNFKDVLVSLGIVDVPDNALGFDGAGIITQVGEDVRDLKVGDRVMLCGRGTFTTHIRGPEHCVCKIPNDLAFTDAATMPCVFLTAMYALMDLARLEQCESVLIHSGCGGVGLAAIQLAKIIGAEIFVTVGSDDKVEHLMQTYDIPRDHIFNSRSAAFYPDIMRRTDGRGVDVVLNSLSGELLHASWRCVAKFGRMVEIGRRDMLSFGKLDMDYFEANRTYIGLSLDEIVEDRPHIAKRLFARLLSLVEEGLVKSISPITSFAATEVKDCLRHMQKGQTIGKIVVEVPEKMEELGVVNQMKQATFNPAASYLLVGGLGGLGRAIARWMVENGAVHLVFLSRTAGLQEEHVVFLQELRAMGAVCTAVAGDVADEAVLRKTVDETVPPIKGVVQASMVLKDVSLPNMTYGDWMAAAEPKIKGTWNLHNALLSNDLDFFVVLGSLSGIIGQHGQSNYNAANSFLNAFIPHRHALGLAGSILNLSAVSDIGALSNQKPLLSLMREGGAHFLREQDVLEAFHWAIETSKTDQHLQRSTESASITLGLRSRVPLQKLDERHPWKRDRRMALYRNSRYATETHVAVRSHANQDVSPRLQDTMQKIQADPKKVLSDPTTAQILAEEIAKKAFKMLLRPEEEVDVKAVLSAVGLDSLMAMQLRSWWKTVFAVDLNVLQVANAKTFEGLGMVAVSLLQKKLLKDEAKE